MSPPTLRPTYCDHHNFGIVSYLIQQKRLVDMNSARSHEYLWNHRVFWCRGSSNSTKHQGSWTITQPSKSHFEKDQSKRTSFEWRSGSNFGQESNVFITVSLLLSSGFYHQNWNLSDLANLGTLCSSSDTLLASVLDSIDTQQLQTDRSLLSKVWESTWNHTRLSRLLCYYKRIRMTTILPVWMIRVFCSKTEFNVTDDWFYWKLQSIFL